MTIKKFKQKAICKFCGKKFRKHRNEQFCSKECRTKHKKMYHHIYYITNSNFKDCEIYKKCPVCGFIYIPDVTEKELFTGRKYCSKECAALMKKARDMVRYESEYYKQVHRKSSRAYHKKKKKLKGK